MRGHVAVAEIQIEASPARVWSALTDPAEIEQYMFGSRVETDWEPGSRIVWKGEYGGKSYVDHGEILESEPERRLVLTHFSPLGGAEDVEESYHTLTYELHEMDGQTRVTLTQDNNTTSEAAEQSRANWEQMLAGLKALVERATARSAGATRI